MSVGLSKYQNYYFLITGISNLGGSQLLILRRAKYLKLKGLNVKIVVFIHRGEFILEKQFEDFQILYIPVLRKPLFLFSKKEISKILTTISLFYKNHKNTIIETDSLHASIWGELVAKELGYKHVTYLLNENKVNRYILYPGADYFLFKYNRGELYGCSQKSLEIILGKHYDLKRNTYINVAFDSNEVKDFTKPSIKDLILLKNAKTILTISRLEKGYIKQLIDATIEIAIEQPDLNINLIIGGGTLFKNVKEELESKYLPPKLNLNNLKIIFTGYIRIMGKDLFNLSDFFVGMGTASINAISQGCATVVINPSNNKTPGILGIDTTIFAYTDGEDEYYSMKDMITKLLLDDKLLENAKKKGYNLYNSAYTLEACFKKQKELLLKSNKDTNYFKFEISFFRRCLDFPIYILKKIRMNYYKFKK